MSKGIDVHSSETILKDAFLMAGIVAKKGNLSEIIKEIEVLARREFMEEVEDISISKILDDTEFRNVLNIYQKYFVIYKEFWNIDSVINIISNTNTINAEWIRSKKEYLLSMYDDFEDFYFQEDYFPLLEEYYICELLNPKIRAWDREYLSIISEHFIYSRKGAYYKNKKTRKMLSMSNFINLLTTQDKINVINSRLDKLDEILLRFPNNWWYSGAISTLKEILNNEKELLENN